MKLRSGQHIIPGMQQRPGESSSNTRPLLWTAVFRDVQFWVPLTVLLIGLLLLRIVQ